jgi:hypothetical protein
VDVSTLDGALDHAAAVIDILAIATSPETRRSRNQDAAEPYQYRRQVLQKLDQ